MNAMAILRFIFVTFPKLLELAEATIATIRAEQRARAQERDERTIEESTGNLNSPDEQLRLEGARQSEDWINRKGRRP